jgi:hypothetical protein
VLDEPTGLPEGTGVELVADERFNRWVQRASPFQTGEIALWASYRGLQRGRELMNERWHSTHAIRASSGSLSSTAPTVRSTIPALDYARRAYRPG